jgi:curved DNA-binding protein CbpA
MLNRATQTGRHHLTNKSPFVDHYEVLQVSQNADIETIERVYRLLAKRYHPDNSTSGDPERFREIRSAYEILSDSESRAGYDVQYDDEKTIQWKLFEQGSAASSRTDDEKIFHGVLSVLCVARRRDPEAGGLGALNLERMLGVPREHLVFPLWYLRQRRLIEVLDTGLLAITADGFDRLGQHDLSLPENRLLAESRMATVESELQQIR